MDFIVAQLGILETAITQVVTALRTRGQTLLVGLSGPQLGYDGRS
jgi:hypothetical protein